MMMRYVVRPARKASNAASAFFLGVPPPFVNSREGRRTACASPGAVIGSRLVGF
jgi:hypothetical protein